LLSPRLNCLNLVNRLCRGICHKRLGLNIGLFLLELEHELFVNLKGCDLWLGHRFSSLVPHQVGLALVEFALCIHQRFSLQQQLGRRTALLLKLTRALFGLGQLLGQYLGLFGRLGLALDVDAPTREFGRQARILTLFANGQ